MMNLNVPEVGSFCEVYVHEYCWSKWQKSRGLACERVSNLNHHNPAIMTPKLQISTTFPTRHSPTNTILVHISIHTIIHQSFLSSNTSLGQTSLLHQRLTIYVDSSFEKQLTNCLSKPPGVISITTVDSSIPLDLNSLSLSL
jgi:hypothetical protein